MDVITTSIAALNMPLVTWAAELLDSEIFYALLVLFFVFFTEKRWNKRWKIITALVVVTLLCLATKMVMAIERPCAVGFLSKIPCPHDYSFPSTHASIAFILMIAFLGKDIFPVYFVFAIFIAFSRIYLGVHTFEDIAGALAIAAIAYGLVDSFLRSDNDRQ